MKHPARYRSSYIYELIEKDFQFLENYGFKIIHRIYNSRAPQVDFERNEETIIIGFVYEDCRIIAIYTPIDNAPIFEEIICEVKTNHKVPEDLKCKMVMPVDLLKDVELKGKIYDEQYQDAINYLIQLLDKGL